jgi:hypothetical protein
MARSNAARDIGFPISRFLAGSLYKASDKDADGKPRIVKTGQNAGQPTQQFWFAFGVPKTLGAVHWAQESWGNDIWAVGNTCFPKIAEGDQFAWKITDGDSAKPNKKGVAPNTREGYPGHWVVSCSSTYAPKVVNADGSAYILEVDAVMPGDFIEVNATVDGNMSTQNPGVYINHNAVSFQGYCALGRIHSGVDPASLGFGKGPKPAGIVSTPVGAAPAPVATPAAPSAPGKFYAPVAAPPALPGAPVAVPAPVAAPTPVVPAPSFLQPPPAIPAPVAAMPPPPARQMTPKAQGNTYEGLLAQGWTEALLLQHGMVTA